MNDPLSKMSGSARGLRQYMQAIQTKKKKKEEDKDCRSSQVEFRGPVHLHAKKHRSLSGKQAIQSACETVMQMSGERETVCLSVIAFVNVSLMNVGDNLDDPKHNTTVLYCIAQLIFWAQSQTIFRISFVLSQFFLFLVSYVGTVAFILCTKKYSRAIPLWTPQFN